MTNEDHELLSNLNIILRNIINQDDNFQNRIISILKYVAQSYNSHPKYILCKKRQTKLTSYERFLYRSGSCGTRSHFSQIILNHYGVHSHRIGIQNFLGIGRGNHTCIEVSINGKLCFFDVTYGGYFIKDNIILSFSEIIENSNNLSTYLNVFDIHNNKGSLKNNNNYGYDMIDAIEYNKRLTVDSIDARERMLTLFTEQNLKNRYLTWYYSSVAPLKSYIPIYDRPKIYNYDINKSMTNNNSLSLGNLDNRNSDMIRIYRNNEMLFFGLHELGVKYCPIYLNFNIDFTGLPDTIIFTFHIFRNYLRDRKLLIDTDFILLTNNYLDKGAKNFEIKLKKNTNNTGFLKIYSDFTDVRRYIKIDSINIKFI